MANLNAHVKHNSCVRLQCRLSSFQESMFEVIVVKALLISVSKWCVTFANFPFNSYRVIAHFITSKCQPSSNDVRCCCRCVSSRKPRPVSQLVAQQVNQQFAPPSHSKKDKKEKSEKDRSDKEPTLKRKSNKKIR